MKKQLIFLLFVLCCFSCVSQKKEIIKKSTIKLEGKNTNIRELLEIDGYYYIDPPHRQYGSIIFFEDGTWVYFHFKEDISDSEIKTNLSKAIATRKNGKNIEWGTFLGVYTVQNKTIIVHSYDKPAFLKAWDLTEERYEVIDQQTIKRVFFKIRTDDYSKTNSSWLNSKPAHFIPADSLPSSDNWLKENRWIWRNESDWKAYMDRIKAEKKNKK